MEVKLAAIVLNYNDAKTTKRIVELIKTYDTVSKILIVDNCSNDNSYYALEKLKNPKVELIKSDFNGGYGYGNNYGVRYLHNTFHPTHILIANPDVEVKEVVLSKMLDVFAKDSKVAAVAPYMLNRDGKKEPGCAWKLPTKYEYIFSADLFIGHFLKPSYYPNLDKLTDQLKEVDCVAGSLLMVDTAKMLQYGMYDENIFLFGEETTIGCKFKKAGLKTILLLQDSFLHLHGVSINKSIGSQVKKRKLMLTSRQYILKTYLGASKMDLLLAKIVYGISMFEFRLLWMMRRK